MRMRGSVTSWLAGAAVLAASAAGLGIGPGGPQALACGYDCGGRYHPAPFYSAPPVYSYTYAPYGYGPAYRGAYWGHGRAVYVGRYATRVDIFRGPRWGYAAAYYNPRPYRGCRRAGACRHRAYLYGPIFRVGQHW